MHETLDVNELTQWLVKHRNGILIKELSTANVEAVKSAGIDVKNGSDLTPIQLEQISRILQDDKEFPGHEWRPTISDLFWIRPRFPMRLFVIVRFDNPPS